MRRLLLGALALLVGCGHRPAATPPAPRPPAGPCGYPVARFPGELCGPAASPCRLLADDTIDGGANYADFAVDGAGNPFVLYSTGLTARRDAGRWQIELTPFSLRGDPDLDRSPALAFDAAGLLHATADAIDTAGDSTMHSWRYLTYDGGWHDSSPLTAVGARGALVVPAGSCLLGGVVGDKIESIVQLFRKEGDDVTLTPTVMALRLALATSKNGAPHLLLDGTRWIMPPRAEEPVPMTETNRDAVFAVLGEAEGIGEVHVLFSHGMSAQLDKPGQVGHAVRRAGGGWAVDPVVDNQIGFDCTNLAKVPMGTTCTSRNVVHRPIAVLGSDGGDLRLVLLENEQETISSWTDKGFMSHTTLVASAVELMWPDGGGYATARFPVPTGSQSGRALVDAAGHLHVLIFAAALHYLELAP